MNELTKEKKSELAPRQEPSVTDLMQAIIEKGVTGENVKALEALVMLKERVDAKQAEREFAAAFVALQAEMPKVKAQHIVRNSEEKGGGVRYVFAPFEDIMEQVAPLLQKHGFTVSFSTDYAEARLIKLCTLTHTGGYSTTNKFAVTERQPKLQQL